MYCRKRVNTSGAFFLAAENQVTAYYVYRLYKGGLGRQPYHAEFVPDVRAVAGGIIVNNALSADVINSNKAEFAHRFISRADFRARYPADLDASAFVARLTQTAGLALSTADNEALIRGLQNGAETRATVLQKIVDGLRAAPPAGGGVGVDQIFETTYGREFYNREYNRAFVLMQYFGYLRRDPDTEGFNFWLSKLDSIGNFIDAEMVRSFILAAEYRSRFGQP